METLIIRLVCKSCDRLVVVDGYRCFAPRPICAECAKS